MPKTEKYLSDAFKDLIKDLYSAEKQVLKSLPKAIKAVHSDQLKRGLEQHTKDTERQIQRLEQISQIKSFRPTGKTCTGMKGLIDEMNEHIQDYPAGPVRDAVLIADAQKVEHYEIGSYGTAREWAKILGENKIVDLIEQTLKEEKRMDQVGTELAESQINPRAQEEPAEMGYR